MKTLSKTSKQTALKKVRIRMAELELKAAEAANSIGITRSVFRNVIYGHSKTPAIRASVEHFLGIPIWSSEDEFKARKAVAA